MGFGGNGSRFNDYFMDLCIMIFVCKIGLVCRVMVVLFLFFYLRQLDFLYNKVGVFLFKVGLESGKKDYIFDSVFVMLVFGILKIVGFINGIDIMSKLFKIFLINGNGVQFFIK